MKKGDLWIFAFVILLLLAGLTDNGLINEELIQQFFPFAVRNTAFLKGAFYGTN